MQKYLSHFLFLALMILSCLGMSAFPAEAIDPGIVNYTKFSGNPLLSNFTQPNNYTFGGSITETSTIIEGSSVLTWAREGNYIYMINHSNYGDMNVSSRVLTNLPWRMFYEFVIQQPARYKGNFTMLATNWSGGAPEGPVYAFTSKDGTHWTILCNGQDIGAGAGGLYNPSGAHVNNVTYMLIDDRAANRPRYYNKSGEFYDGLCALDFKGYSIPGSLNPWMGVFNDTQTGKQVIVMEYSILYDGSNYEVNWAKGPNPLTFTEQNNRDLLHRSQSWEMTGPDDQADMDIWIVPQASQQYFNVSWGDYYNGNQRDTGLALDRENRSFYTAHNVSALAEGAPFCGDGIITGGESCDDGLDNGVCPSVCSSTCGTQTCIQLPAESQAFNTALLMMGVAALLIMFTSFAHKEGNETLTRWLIALIGIIMVVAVLLLL